MSATEGACWCSGEVRCPHGVTLRMPALWDEMETAVDTCLEAFDRKSIRKFLKRDVEGHEKLAVSAGFKDYYGKNPAALSMEAVNAKVLSKPQNGGKVVHPLHMGPAPGAQPARPGTAPNHQPQHQHKKRKPLDPNMTKPLTLAEGQLVGAVRAGKDGRAHKTRTEEQQSAERLAGSTSLPFLLKPSRESASAPAGLLMQQQQPLDDGWQEEGTGGAERPDEVRPRTSGAPPLAPISAWGSDIFPNSFSSSSSSSKPKTGAAAARGVSSSPTTVEAGLAGDSAVAMGLMRVADILARKVLPWQALTCPRAVECLRDSRLSLVLSKHEQFVDRMRQQLEGKVVAFLDKKDEEVGMWIQREMEVWKLAMAQQEADQSDFFRSDAERTQQRAAAQEGALKAREVALATELDDRERGNTREQLIKFRRLCRSEGVIHNAESRALQASFEVAQGRVNAGQTINLREVAKRREAAFDWLTCIADNSMVAAGAEVMLQDLYAGLDKERARAVGSLHSAMSSYVEQHNVILDSIIAFSGRVRQHAQDFLHREQLIGRAFLQYLLSVISGEVRPHTSEVKRSSIAWEGKFTADRAHRRDTALHRDFNLAMLPFDNCVSELRERMVKQLEHVTVKMQSVLNGRESDINKKKAAIHRKLGKHVNKSCNARRLRLKGNKASSREEQQLEERALVSLNDLTVELRQAVDQIWVKEHLRERRMYEASRGRLERLEKSALIIWNKHSYLAMAQQEDYQDWLNMYRRDRDMKLQERQLLVTKDWDAWRRHYGEGYKKVRRLLRPRVKHFISAAVAYDATVPMEKNMATINRHEGTLGAWCQSMLGHLRRVAEEHVKQEVLKADKYCDERRAALVSEWQDNLFRLNDAINRRVGTLKDMEADLEETLRLALAQNEIETCVFEQTSCARMDNFWVQVRSASGQNPEGFPRGKQYPQNFPLTSSTILPPHPRRAEASWLHWAASSRTRSGKWWYCGRPRASRRAERTASWTACLSSPTWRSPPGGHRAREARIRTNGYCRRARARAPRQACSSLPKRRPRPCLTQCVSSVCWMRCAASTTASLCTKSRGPWSRLKRTWGWAGRGRCLRTWRRERCLRSVTCFGTRPS